MPNIIYGKVTLYCAGAKSPLSTAIDPNLMIIYDYGVLPRDVYHPIDGRFTFEFKGEGYLVVFFDLETAGAKEILSPGQYDISVIDCFGA